MFPQEIDKHAEFDLTEIIPLQHTVVQLQDEKRLVGLGHMPSIYQLWQSARSVWLY